MFTFYPVKSQIMQTLTALVKMERRPINVIDMGDSIAVSVNVRADQREEFEAICAALELSLDSNAAVAAPKRSRRERIEE
jgi:ABC-type enterobactin transport system permease subunit